MTSNSSSKQSFEIWSHLKWFEVIWNDLKSFEMTSTSSSKQSSALEVNSWNSWEVEWLRTLLNSLFLRRQMTSNECSTLEKFYPCAYRLPRTGRTSQRVELSFEVIWLLKKRLLRRVRSHSTSQRVRLLLNVICTMTCSWKFACVRAAHCGQVRNSQKVNPLLNLICTMTCSWLLRISHRPVCAPPVTDK